MLYKQKSVVVVFFVFFFTVCQLSQMFKYGQTKAEIKKDTGGENGERRKATIVDRNGSAGQVRGVGADRAWPGARRERGAQWY